MIDMIKPEIIAFYLPQFHPFPENDNWWGKGFTEWTNVGKARKLFPGHYQPRIPADLGYYDLRLSLIYEQQVQLAREAGVTAFCFYEYWFGGKRLMERPLVDMIERGVPDFPFCICWANHTWTNNNWNAAAQRVERKVLIEQTYPGIDDIDNHFYALLPAFSDKRYLRIDDRLVFVIYDYKSIPGHYPMLTRWNELARKNNLPEFYFMAYTADPREVKHPRYNVFDNVILSNINGAFGQGHSVKRLLKDVLINRFLHLPAHVVSYRKAIKKMLCPAFENEKVVPVVVPNWDHSPRLATGGSIFHNSTPELFKRHLTDILLITRQKRVVQPMIFIKSWNEWGEGNYMEPDLRFGKQYIEACRQTINAFDWTMDGTL